MTSEVLQEGYFGGDLIIEEGASPLVTRETVEYTNEFDVAMRIPTGHPVKSDGDVIFAVNDSELDDVWGTVIHSVYIPAGETKKLCVLRRGPAAINKAALATQYFVVLTGATGGGDIDVDTLATNIEANCAGVVVREEPLSLVGVTEPAPVG